MSYKCTVEILKFVNLVEQRNFKTFINQETFIKVNFNFQNFARIHVYVRIRQQLRSEKAAGCSLIIVFFPNFKNIPDSVFPRCPCVYTHQAGRKPVLQQY